MERLNSKLTKLVIFAFFMTGCTSGTMTISGSLFNADSPSTSTPSSTSTGGPISPYPTGIPSGATVVSPGSNIASAVETCSGGTVYFNPGTYSLKSSINVPANCTLMGSPKWASIITGGTGLNGAPVFQLNRSSNITVTGLNFQNMNGGAVGNIGGSGSGNITGTHIYLNLFEHFANEEIPIFIYDPKNIVIERNAFNYMLEDGIHLYSSSDAGGTVEYPSSNVIVRWNFAANQGYGTGWTGAFIEIQLGTSGLEVYQNVYYSQPSGSGYGMALSIACGGPPCTSSNGPSGCTPLDNGKNGVTIDGNIILDNNIKANVSDDLTGIEVMGVDPLVQNNYIRHWAGIGMYTIIMNYTAANQSYTYGNGTLTVNNNTACDGYNESTFDFYNESDSNSPPIIVNYSGNQYSTSCANIAAPPLLYPQIVVPPDTLDSKGGMWAISNSTDTGPNTYWPNINVAAGF